MFKTGDYYETTAQYDNVKSDSFSDKDLGLYMSDGIYGYLSTLGGHFSQYPGPKGSLPDPKGDRENLVQRCDYEAD
jgi:hypothetical protein